MKDKFTDIADLKFTAHMEEKLDSVEGGSIPGRGFCGTSTDFDKSLKQASRTWRACAIKVPARCPRRSARSAGGILVVKMAVRPLRPAGLSGV